MITKTSFLNILFRACYFFILVCTGCSSKNKDNERGLVNLQVVLKSDAQLNQNRIGASNPVRISLYQLNQEEAFNVADYFTLQQQSDSDLVSDVKKLASYVVNPAEERKVYLTLAEKVTKIGVVTAYQDINRAHWRTIINVPQKPERHWYNGLWSENKKWQPVVIIHLKNLDTSVE